MYESGIWNVMDVCRWYACDIIFSTYDEPHLLVSSSQTSPKFDRCMKWNICIFLLSECPIQKVFSSNWKKHVSLLTGIQVGCRASWARSKQGFGSAETRPSTPICLASRSQRMVLLCCRKTQVSQHSGTFSWIHYVITEQLQLNTVLNQWPSCTALIMLTWDDWIMNKLVALSGKSLPLWLCNIY